MFESLSDKLQKAFTGFKSKGHLTEDDINDGIREIRMALLEADVNYKVVKNFTRRVKERCLTAEVMDSLTPGQNVIKIVFHELTELLGGTTAELTFGSRIPGVVMLVGLQGSGKTTAAAKLAYRLGKQGHNPLLVACDVYRPAAADQLQTLGDEMGVRVYRGDGKDPVKIATEGVRDAIDNLRDVVIIDTAGRLHVDEEMMDEAVAIRDAVEPDQILMVVDAMTGQDVVNVAAAFAEQVDFDGVIMSKMDGDARGGGALSIREVTGKPIKFAGVGEKLDAIEVFHPDRMASRILGMGDVLTLIEKAEAAVDEKKAQELAEKLKKNRFTLTDYLDQLNSMKNMGSLQELAGMVPGLDAKALAGAKIDEKAMAHTEAIILSMTPAERENPSILNSSRKRRIAAGAGVGVVDINRLLKQFEMMQTMARQLSGKKMKRFQRGGGKMPFGF